MSIPDFRAYNDALRDKAELEALTAEDGEQCIHCLRFTYMPGYGCLHCGFGLSGDEIRRHDDEPPGGSQ